MVSVTRLLLIFLFNPFVADDLHTQSSRIREKICRLLHNIILYTVMDFFCAQGSLIQISKTAVVKKKKNTVRNTHAIIAHTALPATAHTIIYR